MARLPAVLLATALLVACVTGQEDEAGLESTSTLVLQPGGCEGARHPIVILPGIMASQINGSYNGMVPSSPCVGRRKMKAIWPPTARNILPTGFDCWKYMIQPEWDEHAKRFVTPRGVSISVESGGPTGMDYNLWRQSYANITNFLMERFGYTPGKDLFGAPFDWRLHLTGIYQSGQMAALAGKVEKAVALNCGKKAVLLGHSMGGLVSTALLHSNPAWAQRYVKSLITVSAPFGGTSDQAISVRMGAVDFNIGEWVKLPMARAAAEVAANANHTAQLATAAQAEELDADTALLPLASRSMRLWGPGAIVSGDAAADELDSPAGAGIATAALPAAAAPAASPAPGSPVPAPFNRLLKNYVSSLFFKVTMGLPGLSMLLPYASAYGARRRIVVTPRRTYTASMMRRLVGDIGDAVTDAAWAQVAELDYLLAQGPLPGIPTFCLYAHEHPTTLTWRFPDARPMKPMLVSEALATAGGDGTVTAQSLAQCARITSHVTQLGNYGHLEVLKDAAPLEQLALVLKQALAETPAATSPVPAGKPAPAITRTPAAWWSQWLADLRPEEPVPEGTGPEYEEEDEAPDSSSSSSSSGGGGGGGGQDTLEVGAGDATQAAGSSQTPQPSSSTTAGGLSSELQPSWPPKLPEPGAKIPGTRVVVGASSVLHKAQQVAGPLTKASSVAQALARDSQLAAALRSASAVAQRLDTYQQVVDEARDTITAVRDSAPGAITAIGSRIGQLKQQLPSQLSSVAGKLRGQQGE